MRRTPESERRAKRHGRRSRRVGGHSSRQGSRPELRKHAHRARAEGEADALDELDTSLFGAEDPPPLLDPPPFGDEARAIEEGRRAAERKLRLWRRFWRLAIVGVPLLIIQPWLGFVVLLVGGIVLARRTYSVLYEPRLRERLIDEEVSKRVARAGRGAPADRASEREHARALEKLSASIAHEIRNPITAAKSLVQQMGEDPGASDNAEYARVVLQELERVERSISHLLRFAREEALRPEPLRMLDVLASALETFRERAAREGVEIVREFDCEGTLFGDAEKLRRIVINLVGNAMDSLAEARVEKPRITLAMGENLAGSEVWLRIADNGPGVTPEVGARIFDPFYTSKEHGTGLGLPITKKLVEAHGGTIEWVSHSAGGAEFVLSLPKRRADGGARA